MSGLKHPPSPLTCAQVSPSMHACQLDTKAPDKIYAKEKGEPEEPSNLLSPSRLPVSLSGATRWQGKSAKTLIPINRPKRPWKRGHGRNPPKTSPKLLQMSQIEGFTNKLYFRPRYSSYIRLMPYTNVRCIFANNRAFGG